MENQTQRVSMSYHWQSPINHVFDMGDNNQLNATQHSRKLVMNLDCKGRLGEFQAQIQKGIYIGSLVVMMRRR